MAHETSVTQVKAALKKHCGIVVRAAEELGITRQALHARIDRSKPLQAFVREIELDVLEHALGNIHDAIVNQKDIKTSRWYAERKAKHLGFGTHLAAQIGFDPAEFEAFAASLGGDPEKFRAALAAVRAAKARAS